MVIAHDEFSRLRSLQARIRQLEIEDPLWRRWLHEAFPAHVENMREFTRARERDEQRAREAYVSQLKRGIVIATDLDPKAEEISDPVHGLCPVGAVELMERLNDPEQRTAELQAEIAPFVLAAFLSHERYNSASVEMDEKQRTHESTKAALDAGTHVWFRWELVAPRPDGWEDPINPCYPTYRFDEMTLSQQQTYILLRLGGFADVDSFNPIIESPPNEQPYDVHFAWMGRFPPGAHDHTSKLDEINSSFAQTAEKMFAAAERWIADERRDATEHDTLMGDAGESERDGYVEIKADGMTLGAISAMVHAGDLNRECESIAEELDSIAGHFEKVGQRLTNPSDAPRCREPFEARATNAIARMHETGLFSFIAKESVWVKPKFGDEAKARRFQALEWRSLALFLDLYFNNGAGGYGFAVVEYEKELDAGKLIRTRLPGNDDSIVLHQMRCEQDAELCRKLARVVREAITPIAESPVSTQARNPTGRGPRTESKRLGRDVLIYTALENDPTLTARALANTLMCAASTVCNSPIWKAHQRLISVAGEREWKVALMVALEELQP